MWRTVGHTCGSVCGLTGSGLVAVLVLAGLDSGSLFGSSSTWETDDPMVAASADVWGDTTKMHTGWFPGSRAATVEEQRNALGGNQTQNQQTPQSYYKKREQKYSLVWLIEVENVHTVYSESTFRNVWSGGWAEMCQDTTVERTSLDPKIWTHIDLHVDKIKRLFEPLFLLPQSKQNDAVILESTSPLSQVPTANMQTLIGLGAVFQFSLTAKLVTFLSLFWLKTKKMPHIT